jgi:hypothetical protein
MSVLPAKAPEGPRVVEAVGASRRAKSTAHIGALGEQTDELIGVAPFVADPVRYPHAGLSSLPDHCSRLATAIAAIPPRFLSRVRP